MPYRMYSQELQVIKQSKSDSMYRMGLLSSYVSQYVVFLRHFEHYDNYAANNFCLHNNNICLFEGVIHGIFEKHN